MKAVSHRWVFMVLGVIIFQSQTVFSSVDLCAHIHDSVDPEVQLILAYQKPQIFRPDCNSNVVVEQYPNPTTIRIRGESNRHQPSKMVFQSDEGLDTLMTLPSGDLVQTMSNVCEEFLGCGYIYKTNSLSYDPVSKSPHKEVWNGEVVEVCDEKFQLYEWSRGMIRRDHFVNRLAVKSMQCTKSKFSIFKDDIPSLFGYVIGPNLKIVFVLDTSVSVRNSICHGMNCYDFMIKSFKSQLSKMHSSTQVNLYLYDDISNPHQIQGDGRKVFPHLVSIPEMLEKLNAMEKANALMDKEVVPVDEQPKLNVESMGTHLFYLEDLYDQDLDKVYIFSDFMDYRRVAYQIEWNKLLPIDIEKRHQASWELIVRSFGTEKESIAQFIREIQPDLNLGTVPLQ
ncbi:MAG: hypothetical protein R2877_01135 [Bdellovibrionota bacterium]